MCSLNQAFKKIKADAEKALDDQALHHGANATRWEKAVVATDAIVGKVVSFDHDGVDMVVVGSGQTKQLDGGVANSTENDDITWYPNIKDSQGLEDTVTKRSAGGPCPLGAAMEEVLNKALDRDLKTTPCSVLVLTAGKPDDSLTLQNALRKANLEVIRRGGIEECPLSITFIQIGTDQDASEYLRCISKRMIGIVNTIDYEEIQQTMQHVREHNTPRQKGIGGMDLHEKQHAAAKTTRTDESGPWGGTWKCLYDGKEVATLEVRDKGRGNLSIDGLEKETLDGRYSGHSDAFRVSFAQTYGELVEGIPDASNRALNFSDGTRWEAVPNTKANIPLDNKNCNYMMVLDRSAAMEQEDIQATMTHRPILSVF